MARALSDQGLGLVLVAVSTLAWSTAGLFTRAISEDLFTTLVWRGLFGTAGLLAVLLWRDGVKGLRDFGRLGRAGWAYAAISGLGMYAYIGALRMSSIAHVSIIYAAVPFMTAGLAWVMMGTRPTRDAVIASTVAFLGAVLMVGLGGDGNLLGDGLAVVMTLGMALMMVIARKHPEIPTLPAGITSAVFSVLIALPFAGAMPAGDQLWLLAGFGLINSTLGFALFLMGSARIAPIQTALLGALEAPIAPVWVWLVYGETPTLPTVIGGTVVMVAVLGHILRQYRQNAKA
ncbi:DMT family transporter [Stagnihabitans tardus]|uniref:EamA family transporter n=1 Tax=Stagnihabitans tardus TaxID=2699202 RepID=A0AAE5BW04_9RHOB|nr:DMT family transporter [Stagnihabitans tardus]NBZ88324.1 EamA family transporter [Stagnihabitans tardus]